MATFYPINTPLINYFFYKAPLTQNGPNVPLAGGFLFFYDDADHSVQLPTFSDVSDPNNPTANLNPIQLGAAGDCPLFYLEDRPYYIVITDSSGDQDNPVATINHYNPGGGNGEGASPPSIPNYIGNGQFLLHNNIAATPTTEAGQVTLPTTEIAPGNWTFDVPSGTASISLVTFVRYNVYSANPPANPLYAVRIQAQEVDSGDSFKDLTITFPDVNRFASAKQQYTISFSGIDNLAENTAIQLVLYKYFGSGGSAPVETILTTFNMAATSKVFSYSFIFGDNSAYTIGPNNDSYVSISLRLPLLQTSDVSFTNFCLEIGPVTNPLYPETTQQEDVSAALGGGFPVPDYDGANIGLTPILTLNGWAYDNSSIGFIMPTLLATAPNGWLLGDGTSYRYSGYSSIGIPYRRLADKLWNSIGNFFITGTGYQFATMQASDVTPTVGQARISTNQPGAQTAAADGAIATGFTFNPIAAGGSYSLIGYVRADNQIWVRTTIKGAPPSDPGTSGFTINTYKNYTNGYGQFLINLNAATPSSLQNNWFRVNAVGGTNYFWFKKDGVGTDPTPSGGGPGIPINLGSNFNLSEIAKAIAEAVSGKTNSEIIFTAGTPVPAGSYWRFSANSSNYLVYQVKDGVGNDPDVPGVISIPANITSSGTDIDVMNANIIAVNKFMIGMPDLRGWSLKFWNSTNVIDALAANRFAQFSNLTGNNIATYDWDIFGDHQHTYSGVSVDLVNVVGSGGQSVVKDLTIPSALTSGAETDFGGPQTQDANFYVNALIKY